MEPRHNLEHQYQQWIKLMNLDESTMLPEQKRQTKQAFFGAAGQLLLTVREDLMEMPPKEGFNALQSMLEQVQKYWTIETEQYKARNQ